MKKYGILNYRGTFSKDMLLKQINKNESVVINLQDYFNGQGTHWTAVYNSPESTDIEYFDSFGLVPPNEVVKYMRGVKNLIYNGSQIQGINSIMCGYYCVYYIMKRYEGITPDKILLDFHERPDLFNETFIQYFSTYI